MEYSFTANDDGPTLGLHRAGRWDEVLEIEKCWLTSDLGNAIRNRMREWAREEKLAAYDQATHEGYLRHLVVREGRNTGQALVQLVTARGERFDRERLIEVLTEFPEVKSIHWTVNRRAGRGDEPADGAPLGRGRDRGGDRRPPLPRPAERVPADEHARWPSGSTRSRATSRRSTGGETVYDLYCGIGTIGLSMAPSALTVWGIEISEESVACAIENQELNGDRERRVLRRQRGRGAAELRDRAGDPDVVVVDPPRAGLAGKALKRLGEIGAPRVVYVSCNPTTLAGDLKRLSDDYGYRLVRAQPVDMFPHTPHVECVALLVLRQPSRSSDTCSGCRTARARAGRRSATRNPSEMRRQRGQAAECLEPRRRARSSARGRRPCRRHVQRRAGGSARSRRGRARRRARPARRAARASPPGHRERERERREHSRDACRDRLRRSAPDRVRVDARDDARDEHHPRDRLEQPEEHPADERAARRACAKFAEDVAVDRGRETTASTTKPTGREDSQPRVPQRQRQQDEHEDAPGSARTRSTRRSPPEPRVPECACRLVVGDERREER